jgi:hypothetical protein
LSRKELHVFDGYVESVYNTNVAYKVLLARNNAISEGEVISTDTAFILHTVFSRFVLYIFGPLRHFIDSMELSCVGVGSSVIVTACLALRTVLRLMIVA